MEKISSGNSLCVSFPCWKCIEVGNDAYVDIMVDMLVNNQALQDSVEINFGHAWWPIYGLQIKSLLINYSLTSLNF